MNNCGIYKLVNLVNNHCYVGSSVNLRRRKRQHFYDLNTQQHHSDYLQKAYNKYGKANFDFVVICHCSQEDLVNLEQYYIDKLEPVYNILKFAHSGIGYKHTEATKLHLSQVNKGKSPWSKGLTGVFSKETLQIKSEQQKHKRGVVKVDPKTNTHIETFDSMSGALRSLGKSKNWCSNLKRAIKNNTKMLGFKWIWANEIC